MFWRFCKYHKKKSAFETYRTNLVNYRYVIRLWFTVIVGGGGKMINYQSLVLITFSITFSLFFNDDMGIPFSLDRSHTTT